MKKFLHLLFFGKYADEREMQELLAIGNVSFYILLFALGIAVIVQISVLKIPPQNLSGELICILIGAVSLLTGCIARGVGINSYFKKGKASPFKLSLLTALATAVIGTVIAAVEKHTTLSQLEAGTYAAILAIQFVSMFLIVFIGCYAFSAAVKSREKKLENKYQEDGQEK